MRLTAGYEPSMNQSIGSRILGLGSWVCGLGFGVLGLRSWVWGLGSAVLGLGSEVSSHWSWVFSLGSQVLDLGSWALGPGSWVLGPGSGCYLVCFLLHVRSCSNNRRGEGVGGEVWVLGVGGNYVCPHFPHDPVTITEGTGGGGGEWGIAPSAPIFDRIPKQAKQQQNSF